MSNEGDKYETYKTDSPGSRFTSKAKDNPAMATGLALGVGILGYMAWGLTHRKPGEKLSVYLIHTRLGVQGAIIGTLAAAMTYQIYQEHIAPRFRKD